MKRDDDITTYETYQLKYLTKITFGKIQTWKLLRKTEDGPILIRWFLYWSSATFKIISRQFIIGANVNALIFNDLNENVGGRSKDIIWQWPNDHKLLFSSLRVLEYLIIIHYSDWWKHNFISFDDKVALRSDTDGSRATIVIGPPTVGLYSSNIKPTEIPYLIFISKFNE